MAQQVCAAHSLVLTRLDIATSQQLADAVAEVKAMSPTARIIANPDPMERARAALGVSNIDAASGAVEESCSKSTFSQHPRIQVFTLRWSTELPWDHIAAWLENLVFYFDSRLLRTKGLVRLQNGQVLLIQGVGQHLDTPRVMAAPSTRDSSLVVICRDASDAEVTALDPAIPGLEIVSHNSGSLSIKLARPIAN